MKVIFPYSIQYTVNWDSLRYFKKLYVSWFIMTMYLIWQKYLSGKMQVFIRQLHTLDKYNFITYS